MVYIVGRNDTLPEGTTSIPWTRIVLGTILYIVVAITIFGNCLVLLAVAKEKRLRTVFNYYIVNLAVTDIAVAVTAMSFYTTENILGYWPFGTFMCGLWVFFDYGMTFASVFTLLVISIDRFWSVSWSLHYRRHHTKKKAYICIAAVWIVMLLLWLPACINDRIHNSTPYECKWEPSQNKIFVIIIAIIGHHGSCLILIYCYVRVFLFMRQRVKTGPIGDKGAGPRQIASVTTGKLSGCKQNNQLEVFKKGKTPSTQDCDDPNTNKIGDPEPTVAIADDASPSSSSCPEERRKPNDNNPANDGVDSKEMTENREKRVFVMLTYILFGYMICWVPFHFVFEISAIDPSLVPEIIYTITFWMAYLNSTINPFLYNFSSSEFRRAFRKILCRK